MSRSLDGKIAVITGAASGIGAAIARRFAAGGAKLLLADIDERNGMALAESLGAIFMTTDVSDEGAVAAAIDAAVARYGRLDIMINNAGVTGPRAKIRDVGADEWRRTIAILLDSVFFGIKHAARVMSREQGGCIVSTASVAGIGAFGPTVYTAAKHGVVGLTKAAASELAVDGIRVNAVAPGVVPSAMTARFFGGEEQARAATVSTTPLGLAVEAEDVAEAFAYLCGPGGWTITGQVLTLDAGFSACPRAVRSPTA